ncbi:hypothetical protein GCM10023322_53840 [Rugosimonospora acidiphila]|uniref:Uncharacterized protein n=1 Tax=Rugosimonospora acidiphila TaxID=556531 RepID=A0ABP9S977_9ACTN
MSNRTRAGLPFPSDEWDLLVRLPGRVAVAATSAEPDTSRRTLVEGAAGAEAIAAARGSDSRLVRGVAETIDEGADNDPPAAEEFSDREAAIAGVLDACRLAAASLAAHAEPADSGAYRAWIESIAESVCQASRSGGVLGLGGVTISPAERRFLDDLAAAFEC